VVRSFALKLEDINATNQLLQMEVLVLQQLAAVRGRHFCAIYDRGHYLSWNYVVMTMVGTSLHDLRKATSAQHFTMGTCLSVGIQCLEALEDLHNIGYLHRDVKPGNYTIGRQESNELRKVYILDFGMARMYIKIDPVTGARTIRRPRNVAGFRGTLRYAAIGVHENRDQCRKDDVEGWFYTLIELTTGNIPWKSLEENAAVADFKRKVRQPNYANLLLGGCPREYAEIMRLIDNTAYFDKPPYDRIYALLRQAMRSTNAIEFPYDWERTLPRH